MKAFLPAALLALPVGFLAMAQAPVAPPAPVAADAADYIRYVAAPGGEGLDAASPDRLQTAITRFEKDGVAIDLVGVVHLADAVYYAVLNERLAAYDVVLYEMVGGPHRPGEAPPADGETGIESVRQLQQLAKSFLGLEFQLEVIDYGAPNFVHADMDWAEMNALMKARNETLLTLFTRASALAEEGGVAGLPSSEEAMEAMMKRVFNAVLTGDNAGLKRSVAPFLSEAEGFIAQLEGEDGSVLVSERNRVVMEKLAELRAQKGRGSYAIFYGAGHMPDFEKRLLAEGFTKGEEVWLDAWSIPAGSTPGGGASPFEGVLRLLSENPEIMNGLRDLGTTLEDLGGALKSLTPPAGQ